MVQRLAEPLADLYESDETAWLEAMSELIQQGQLDELDYHHLAEYLADMARRDRREVMSRLRILIAHLLKWTHQPGQRSRSWRASIIEQRQELAEAIGTGVLRGHAEAVLGAAYGAAVEQAAAETGLAPATFPSECPYTLEQLLSPEVLQDQPAPRRATPKRRKRK